MADKITGKDAAATAAQLRPAPVRRMKLHEEVAKRIEALIREGGFREGDALPSEREFMEMFAVGRLAVREAMLLLQRMGLVVVSNGERARVATPSAKAMVQELSGVARLLLAEADGIRHFQQARALLEVGLARLAAKLASDADIDELREILERCRGVLGQPESFLKLDAAFHVKIAAISRNPIFSAVYEGVIEWLTNQRTVSALSSDGNATAQAAHEEIFKAIAAHDPDAAGAAMERHLEAVVERYWQMREAMERSD